MSFSIIGRNTKVQHEQEKSLKDTHVQQILLNGFE